MDLWHYKCLILSVQESTLDVKILTYKVCPHAERVNEAFKMAATDQLQNFVGAKSYSEIIQF